MAEYIERDALVKNLNCFAPEHYTELINDLIMKQPAADVEPVRYGHWEVGYFHDRVCSCCLHPDNDFNEYSHDYCPNCGAKMDGKDKTNDEL